MEAVIKLRPHSPKINLKMRNRDAEASAITSGEGQVVKRENS